MRQLVDIEIMGYVSHEVDFSTVLARQTEGVQNVFNTEVVTPLTDAEMVPEAGKFCTVTIVGHSDRVDTPGLSAEQRRADELNVCMQREESAEQFLFSQLQELVQQAGGTIPATVADMQNGAIFTVAAGAANLLHTVPASEQDRQDNRRVQFLVARFEPETPTL